jgi:7-cyano-7-deazaguanine synthase in queuosine biosynthesis
VRVTVLFSGGVDSLCVARWAQQRFIDVRGVYYDVGQGYSLREITQARIVAQAIKMPFRVETPMQLHEDLITGRVELRNVFFLLLASRGSDVVCYGELRAEEPPDKTPIFRRRMQTLIQSQRQTKFRIYAPFSTYSKAQMVRDYKRRYGTTALSDTVACLKALAPACGECISCFNRWLAWRENDLPEEPHIVHPAQAMLDRLRYMHRHSDSRNWQSVNMRRLWLRRQWVWECRRQLNIYCRKKHGMSAWRYAHT